MIIKQKRSLPRLYFLVVFSFLIPLVGFFIYASKNHIAFIFISTALMINLLLLIRFHRRLSRKQSNMMLEKEEYFERANIMKIELEHEWETIESFRKRILNYSQLKDLTEKLSLCLSLEETSNVLSSHVSQLFGYKDVTVILYLFHSTSGELGISSSQKGQMQVNLKAKKGDLFDQWVVKTLHPLLVEDANSDFRFDIEKKNREENRGVRSLIAAPLLVADKTLGILRVDSLSEHHFTTDDLRFLRTITDVTSIAIENAQLYEKLENLAIRDGLTGLFLRRYMQDHLNDEMNRGAHARKNLSFIMIDLDHFKKYNDSFGHIAGDIVLKTVAKLLEEYFDQPGDLVCRYGGEEFCVLLLDVNKTEAMRKANEIRKRIAQHEIILRRQKTHVTASFGVASFPEDSILKDELVFKADEALYKAKEGGRNRVCAA